MEGETRTDLGLIEGEMTGVLMGPLKEEGGMMRGLEEEGRRTEEKIEVDDLMIRMMIEEVDKEEEMTGIQTGGMTGDQRRKGRMTRELEEETETGRRVTGEGEEVGEEEVD